MTSKPVALPPPQLSRSAVATVGAVFALVAGAVALSLVRVLGAPLLASGSLPQAWSPASAAGLVGLSVLSVAFLGASLYRRVNTQLSSTGLTVPTFRGMQHLPWSAVEQVSGKGVQIKLRFPNTTVVLNTLCYESPRAVAPFLRAHLPEALFGTRR